MAKYIHINEADNVAVALEQLKQGETCLGVTLREDIPAAVITAPVPCFIIYASFTPRRGAAH